MLQVKGPLWQRTLPSCSASCQPADKHQRTTLQEALHDRSTAHERGSTGCPEAYEGTLSRRQRASLRTCERTCPSSATGQAPESVRHTKLSWNEQVHLVAVLEKLKGLVAVHSNVPPHPMVDVPVKHELSSRMPRTKGSVTLSKAGR